MFKKMPLEVGRMVEFCVLDVLGGMGWGGETTCQKRGRLKKGERKDPCPSLHLSKYPSGTRSKPPFLYIVFSRIWLLAPRPTQLNLSTLLILFLTFPSLFSPPAPYSIPSTLENTILFLLLDRNIQYCFYSYVALSLSYKVVQWFKWGIIMFLICMLLKTLCQLLSYYKKHSDSRKEDITNQIQTRK